MLSAAVVLGIPDGFPIPLEMAVWILRWALYLSMFMLLLQGGAILDISAEQTAKQQERELKGSLGTDGTYIYLVVVENASLVES